MKRTSLLFIVVGVLFLRISVEKSYAQPALLSTPGLLPSSSIAGSDGILPSNAISHFAVRGSTLWIGSSKGLSRTSDAGRTFVDYRSVPEFARPGIFAVSVKGDTVWAATGYSKDVDNSSVQTGSGYTFSFNNGSTWHSSPQPIDALNDSVVFYGSNRIQFLPIVVPEQNVTFDLSVVDSTVWIASWSSGVRKSTDNGTTWQRIVLPSSTRSSISPSDSLGRYVVDPRRDNNYLAFAVYTTDNRTVWVGTAGGLNKSTDGGSSWKKFTTVNQSAHFTGNWIIAIKGQHLETRERLWITDWPAESSTEHYGISCSDDSGATWQNFLSGIKAYDFAFKDSVVYVATDEGLYRSSDKGLSWRSNAGAIVDKSGRDAVTGGTVFSVAVMGDTVYAGTGDGLARTIDDGGHPFGQEWEVFRSSQPLPSASSTYAYPNPFSPRQEVVRFHYSTGGKTGPVTLEVFDFGMNRLKTVVRDAVRDGSGEHDEIWDGTDDAGRGVLNGVYFYRLTVGGNDASWGKVMVLQ
jgi:hypothetical protein